MSTKHDFPAPPPSASPNGQLLCLTICGHRRPGMSEEDYRRHMTQVSGPMTKGLMVKYGIIRWTMLHNTTETRNLMRQLFDEHMINLAEFDCFSQVTFKSIEDYKRMRDDDWYRKQIAGDHVNFADTQRSSMTIGWVTDFIEHGKLVEEGSSSSSSSSTTSFEATTRKLQATAILLGSFLSGCMTSLSTVGVPVFLETTPQPPQLFHQWTRMYHYGHQVLPGMAICTFALYTCACLRNRRAEKPKPWRFLLLAGLVTVSIIPFTLLVMKPTNDELFRLESVTRAVRDGEVGAGVGEGMGIMEAKGLVVKWAWMHMTRSTFPLIGAMIGAVGTILS